VTLPTAVRDPLFDSRQIRSDWKFHGILQSLEEKVQLVSFKRYLLFSFLFYSPRIRFSLLKWSSNSIINSCTTNIDICRSRAALDLVGKHYLKKWKCFAYWPTCVNMTILKHALWQFVFSELGACNYQRWSFSKFTTATNYIDHCNFVSRLFVLIHRGSMIQVVLLSTVAGQYISVLLS